MLHENIRQNGLEASCIYRIKGSRHIIQNVEFLLEIFGRNEIAKWLSTD